MSYVHEWSAVPEARYSEAQSAEEKFWSDQDARRLTLRAKCQFYAGYYEWTKNGRLTWPFREDSFPPTDFHIPIDAVKGKSVLDVGCGPVSHTLSLVHVAEVHVVDPLLDFYRTIQPFGWGFYSSTTSAGAERLPFPDQTHDFAHCWNALDHTEHAHEVLREIVRVLRPHGQLMLGCDLRFGEGGGPPHPYSWDQATFEDEVMRYFEPVSRILLLDSDKAPLSGELDEGQTVFWLCHLQKKE